MIFPNDNESSEKQDLNHAKVDLMNLKIWALLMAVGERQDKADIVFDMIMGPKTTMKGFQKSENDSISWVSPRFINVIRKIIYFSEVFPKKYLTYFG